METLIGVDIGTQGTKTALFDRSGTCLAEAFYESELKRPEPGVVEEDPEQQLQSVCDGIRSCLERSGASPRSVAGIAIDGQMAGLLAVGQDGKNAIPYDSWLDTRCSPYVDLMKQRAGDEIVRKAGGAPSINHGPKKLWWMHEHPEVFEAIRAFVQPGGYVAMRLCGLDGDHAFIDKSYLHFSGFADNQSSRWDDELCRRFEMPKEKLPRIVDSHEVVGKTTGEMSRGCGLREGTPVVAGCGDTAASFLACGATREGVCVDVAGTASVFAGTTSGFEPDVRYSTLGFGRSATPGLWHPYAYLNGGGMNLEWFRKELVNRHAGSGHEISFERLNELAEALGPDADVPLFVPHVAGRVCPPEPSLKGSWAYLDWSHKLEHLYRALLESVAMEYGMYKRILIELLPDLDLQEIRITGGGEKSALWNRMKASILGIPVVQISETQGAPMGSAMLAGFGVGLFDSLERVSHNWVHTGATVHGDDQWNKALAAKTDRYQALVETMATLYRTQLEGRRN